MEQQHAAEAAGHEYLEDDERVDGVSKINEEHFEMATCESRRSMSVAQARHHPGRDRRAGDGGGENLYRTHRKLLGERLPGVAVAERERDGK